MKSPELVGFLIGLGIVFLISLWIAIDAQNNRIPTFGDEYNINTGALTWFLAGPFLCGLFIIPIYLIKRSAVMTKRAEQRRREYATEARERVLEQERRERERELEEVIADLRHRVRDLQFDIASLLRLLQSKNLLTPTDMALLIAKRVLPDSNLPGAPSFQADQEATAIQAIPAERKK